MQAGDLSGRPAGQLPTHPVGHQAPDRDQLAEPRDVHLRELCFRRKFAANQLGSLLAHTEAWLRNRACSPAIDRSVEGDATSHRTLQEDLVDKRHGLKGASIAGGPGPSC